MITVGPKNITSPFMPLGGMIGIASPANTPTYDLYHMTLYGQGSHPNSPISAGIFRYSGNFGFNGKGPKEDGWLERTTDFFKKTFLGLVQLFNSPVPPLFGPPVLELAGTGMVMPASAIEEAKFEHMSLMTGDAPPDSVIPNLHISKEQLIKRLRENNYKEKDIKIADAIFGNIHGVEASLQQRSIRVAFKLIDWRASIYGVAAALCQHTSRPTLMDAININIGRILDNKQQLEKIPCHCSDKDQVDYFRSLMFLLAEDIDSFLLIAAEDLIDLEQAMQMPSCSPTNVVDKERRAFMVTSWVLKLLSYSDDGGKLEDLALLHLQPEDYHKVENRLREINGMDRAASLGELRELVELMHLVLEEAEKHKNEKEKVLLHKIIYRVKRIASAKRRGETKGNYADTNGIRIILDSNEARHCYKALEIVEKFFKEANWTVEVYRDYIYKPKPNGYRSLHVTFKDDSGYTVEIQIRTKQMNRTAEIGSAAHGSYKTGEQISIRSEAEDRIAQEIFDSKRRGMISAGVVFVYDETNGNIIKLVPSSPNISPTVLDFAFARSTQEGLRASTGFIDGNVAKLEDPLTTGQRIRVKTGSRSQINGRQKIVSTYRAKTVLAIAAQNMQAVLDGKFDLQSFVNRGRKDFDNIVSQIESELHRLYGSRFALGKPKHRFSIRRLYNRMGFNDEDMFYATLAALPEGAERKKFKAEVQRRIKTNWISYSHNQDHLEIISTGESSLLKQLFKTFKQRGIALQSMEISHIQGTSYYKTSISIEKKFTRSFLGDLKQLSEHVANPESRSSSSLNIKVRIRRNSPKPEIAKAIVNAILSFGAEIKACSIPKASHEEAVEYSFRIHLPQGLSKMKGALRLATLLDKFQGTGQIVIV